MSRKSSCKYLQVEFFNLDAGNRVPKNFLQTHLQRWARTSVCQNLLTRRDHACLRSRPIIRLVFVSKDEIARLNEQFRHKPKATDILSFQHDESGVLGELIISLDVVRQQAKELGIGYSDEILFLVLHGILHLLGYDHEQDERSARKMFAIQTKFFQCLRPTAKGLKNGAYDRVV